MQIKKIDIDTLGINPKPTWAKVTAVINGTEVTVVLEEAQVEEVCRVTEYMVERLLEACVNA